MSDDYSPALLALSPVAYWKMDDASGTTLVDQVSNNYPLTIPSTAGVEGRNLPFVPGGPGILDWAGTSSAYAARANSVDLAFTTSNDFTLLGWVASVGALSVRTVLAAKGYNHAGSESRPWYGLTVETTGKARLWLRSAAGVDYQVDSYSAIADAQYVSRGPVHLVAGVYDHTGPTISIYIDGRFEQQAAAAVAAWGTNSNNFEINALNGVGAGTWMGGVAVFDKIITAAQLLDLYEKGRAGVIWYAYQAAQNYQQQTANQVDILDDLALILASVRKTYV